MKNTNDTIGNRTRDLPVCSAVPQPTRCAHANNSEIETIEYLIKILQHFNLNKP